MENYKFEEEIIRKYIVKEKQDRFIWELNNSEKRNTVFWHFAGPKYFKKECLQPIAYMSGDKMRNYLLQLSEAENVYFVGESYIGVLPLKEAVNKAETGEICIIYCGKGIGYYQGEEESGKPPRFLLSAP